MTPAEVAELALGIGNRIDFQWGLFITVHVALFGAIVHVGRPLRRGEKVAVLLICCGFAAINFRQMRAQLILLDAVYADAVRLAKDSAIVAGALIDRMALEQQ